jgi:hypothetical protein
MTIEQDITGQRFGSLTAIRKDTTSKKVNRWIFRCDCGTEKSINKYSVLRGLSTSCGCYANQKRIERNTKHGLFKTEKRLYGCWQDMKNRCYNPHRKKYRIYGARGITVCDAWKNDFMCFYNWAKSNGYADNLTLDRIDVNGNYCPENCRWATVKEQCNNTRRNHKITLNGITKNLVEWLKDFNMRSSSYHYRVHKGLTDNQIFLGE